ncbi:MAG TPA: hypothetical protein PLS73_08720 [Saprospiraceae bacterium]|nr:hypothetical protein [Saprospiraceae bacterium]
MLRNSILLILVLVGVGCSKIYTTKIDTVPMIQSLNPIIGHEFYNSSMGYYVLNLCTEPTLVTGSNIITYKIVECNEEQVIERTSPKYVVKSLYFVFDGNSIYYYTKFKDFANSKFKKQSNRSEFKIISSSEIMETIDVGKDNRRMKGNFTILNVVEDDGIIEDNLLLKNALEHHSYKDNLVVFATLTRAQKSSKLKKYRKLKALESSINLARRPCYKDELKKLEPEKINLLLEIENLSNNKIVEFSIKKIFFYNKESSIDFDFKDFSVDSLLRNSGMELKFKFFYNPVQ